jgi:hypothetical protein
MDGKKFPLKFHNLDPPAVTVLAKQWDQRRDSHDFDLMR